jgi:drug/metabolite transporter (DMT)-like permease
MPVGTANCIFATMPIFMAVIAYFYLHEKITRYEIIPIFTSFIGILIINNPPEDDSSDSDTKSSNKLTYTSKDILIGTLFALSGAVGGAFANTTKRMMKSGINFSVSPFWFAAGCTFWSPIIHSVYQVRREMDGEPTLMTPTYNSKTIGLIVLTSLATFCGQIAESKAF